MLASRITDLSVFVIHFVPVVNEKFKGFPTSHKAKRLEQKEAGDILDGLVKSQFARHSRESGSL